MNRHHILAIVDALSRQETIDILEGEGYACFIHESTEQLKQALIEHALEEKMSLEEYNHLLTTDEI